MVKLLERTSETLEQKAAEHRSSALQASTRVTVWLLAANAAAALLCLNGLLDHKICDWPMTRPLVLLFLAGTSCAFASHIVGLLTANTLAELLAVRATQSRRGQIFRDQHSAFVETHSAMKTKMLAAEGNDIAAAASFRAEAKAFEEQVNNANIKLGELESKIALNTKAIAATQRAQWAGAVLAGVALLTLVLGVTIPVVDNRFVGALCARPSEVASVAPFSEPPTKTPN